MITKQILRAASGWIELGMPDDALEELKALSGDEAAERKVLEIRLAAEMAKKNWQDASETSSELCRLAVDEPDFFLSTAFCLHETGKTKEAKDWLHKGPDALQEMPVYHYNMACYLWTLGEKERARNHLSRAVEMDDSFLESALHDRDLVGMDLG